MVRTHTQHTLPGWLYKAMLLAAAAIWGLGTVVIKQTVDVFPPAWLVAVRYTVSGLLLGIVALPRIVEALRVDARGHVRDSFALGIFLFLSYWFNSSGLTDTTASNSAFLTSLYCVIIPFLGWALIKKKPTGYNIAAAAVCVTGVGCVAYSGQGAFSLRLGDMVTLGSAVWLSFHVLLTAKYAPGRSVVTLTALQFLAAGALGLLAALATGPMPNFSQLSAETWLSLGYLSVCASCIALGLQNVAVAHVNPSQAALFLATESVFGVAFSVALLGEALIASTGAGFVLIFAGIVISEYLPLRAAQKQKGSSRE